MRFGYQKNIIVSIILFLNVLPVYFNCYSEIQQLISRRNSYDNQSFRSKVSLRFSSIANHLQHRIHSTSLPDITAHKGPSKDRAGGMCEDRLMKIAWK